jgi:hypothetical protein
MVRCRRLAFGRSRVHQEARRYDPAVHVNPPSIDQGVVAFIWAFALGAYIYFGLLAVGASGAFAIVISMLSAAAIWLFVRLRGEDRPHA